MLRASALGMPGEKEAELEKRYGKPVQVEVLSYWEDAKNLVYRWNGYEIKVFLCKGKKDWWKGTSQYETVTKEKGEPISDDEINRWLEWNGAGQKWNIGIIEESTTSGIPAEPENRPQKIWDRGDKKVSASYGRFGLRFISQEYKELAG